MRQIRRDYFKWLYKKIKGGNRSYLLLSAYLDQIPFYWDVPNDGNREEDGRRQREAFIESEYRSYHSDDVDAFYIQEVSVFEVLVALCDRIEYNMDGSIDDAHKSRWYVELLQNLGLAWAVDDEFRYTLGAKGEVDHIIDNMLFRRYDYNGNGSLFPLTRRPKKSMKKTELWYQMMQYLDENYS